MDGTIPLPLLLSLSPLTLEGDILCGGNVDVIACANSLPFEDDTAGCVVLGIMRTPGFLTMFVVVVAVPIAVMARFPIPTKGGSGTIGAELRRELTLPSVTGQILWEIPPERAILAGRLGRFPAGSTIVEVVEPTIGSLTGVCP